MADARTALRRLSAGLCACLVFGLVSSASGQEGAEEWGEEQPSAVSPTTPIDGSPMPERLPTALEPVEGPAIEITTAPPEEGAAEFEPVETGLIRTDTFEVASDETETTLEEPDLQLKGPYRGVVPGTRDMLGDFRRYRKSRNVWVTWVGYQPRGNGRVFFQVSQPVVFSLAQVSEREYHLDLQDARLAFSNSRRRLETQHFPGNVASVHIRKLGRRGIRAIIKLKRAVRPTARQHGHYVFVDVP